MPANRFWRSLLSVPAINRRALEKAKSLAADAIIYDLEDAVAPDRKAEARENLIRLYADDRPAGITAIRINPLDTADGRADMEAAIACRPDAVVLPKVGTIGHVSTAVSRLEQDAAAGDMKLWAMIETAEGVVNAAAIAGAFSSARAGGRLEALIVGVNDLRSETGVAPAAGRIYLVPWLMQTVLAARAGGIQVIDGVYNDFADSEGYAAECAEGAAMGFDGKMLIHPNQIAPANHHFGPSDAALAEARAIVAAFSAPGAERLNVVNLNGRMVERLHLEQAEALLLKFATLQTKEKDT